MAFSSGLQSKILKDNTPAWGDGKTEYTYGLKFTGKFESVDGVITLVDNTWEKVTEP